MAVSISRKHDKRAVQRNRYRRGLYDGLLEALKIPTEKHYQCVFTLKKGLKIPERKISQIWIDDALTLFEKRK
jgi:RNase P protein component